MIDDVADVASLRSKIISPCFVFFGRDGSGQFIVYIEGSALVSCNSFSQALSLWFSSFYTWNLEYPKEVVEVCHFFQELVFNLPLGKKKSGTYLSTTTDIRKYIS